MPSFYRLRDGDRARDFVLITLQLPQLNRQTRTALQLLNQRLPAYFVFG
ncbi:hypothetical protein [Rubidibacter lacunae]|nr:hypothetical protein [Rubidibacter lacunae]